LDALSVVLGDQGLSEEAVYVVAEGGRGEAGFEGFQSLVDGWCARGIAFQHIFHASATATTALGLRIALDQRDLMAEIHAVMVLKNCAEQQGFAEEQGISEKLNFVSGYEFGGYAKGDASLYAFIDQVVARNDVPLDWVYTGKALFALNEWLDVEAKKGTVVSDATGVFPVGYCVSLSSIFWYSEHPSLDEIKSNRVSSVSNKSYDHIGSTLPVMASWYTLPSVSSTLMNFLKYPKAPLVVKAAVTVAV
jgi:hypothetical protein